MRPIFKALCAAALVTPLLVAASDAAFAQVHTGTANRGQASRGGGGGGGGPPPNVGPQGAAGGGGFRGGGGGFRGGPGFRGDGFRGRDHFSGNIFIGPSFGWYDPFWWPYGPYGYGWDYYPPPRVVERVYSPPPPDYLGVPDGPPPQQNWYHCRNPEGFYPYVRECNGDWEAVPVTPPPEGPPPPRQGG